MTSESGVEIEFDVVNTWLDVHDQATAVDPPTRQEIPDAVPYVQYNPPRMSASPIWEPGDPLIVTGRDCIRRPLFQIIDDGGDDPFLGTTWRNLLACPKCKVSWDQTTGIVSCWNCGALGVNPAQYSTAVTKEMAQRMIDEKENSRG